MPIFCMLVCGKIRYLLGSLATGRKRQWVIENVDFQGFWMLHLWHLMKLGQHYYIVLFSHLSPFQ